MTNDQKDKGPINRYAQLVAINRTFSVSAAIMLLVILLLPELQPTRGLGQVPVISVLGAALAGSVLISRVLARLSLAFELALVENVSVEELEHKSKENIDYFKREMANKKQRKNRE